MNQITVIKADVTTPAGKTYQIVELGYRDDKGKVRGMKVFGFKDQMPIFDVLKTAKAGEVLNVTYKQNDKGYWVFNTVEKSGEVKDVSAQPAASKSGNWETSEERKARQIYIARQSSLERALKFLEINKPKGALTVDEVLGVAEVFVDYVQNGVHPNTPGANAKSARVE